MTPATEGDKLLKEAFDALKVQDAQHPLLGKIGSYLFDKDVGIMLSYPPGPRFSLQAIGLTPLNTE